MLHAHWCRRCGNSRGYIFRRGYGSGEYSIGFQQWPSTFPNTAMSSLRDFVGSRALKWQISYGSVDSKKIHGNDIYQPKGYPFYMTAYAEVSRKGQRWKGCTPHFRRTKMVIMQVKKLAEFPKTFILPSSTHASPESDPICLVSEMPLITRC